MILSINHSRRPSGGRTQDRRTRRFRPTSEGLEDRNLLSGGYTQANLVSDVVGRAANTDPKLVNAWGLAASTTGPFWVANNGTGTSTLYNGAGQLFPVGNPLVVTIPSPAGGGATSAPTGLVFSATNSFPVSANGQTGTSVFIFSTEDGTIAGWSPAVSQTQAVIAVNNSAAGAVYKGLAVGNNAAGNFLFATDFHDGRVDVFDTNFAKANLAGSFSDPNLPAGFAPFGITNINGSLYVTYAKQDADKHDDVAGAGNGVVDVFDTNGQFLRRFASGGTLNSPWGVVQAPADFGQFSNDILVGNFGDGHITAFDPASGMPLGQLQDANGQAIAISGLWGLSFGNGASAGARNTLFFTAGPNDEQHGLFGSLTANPTQPSPLTASGVSFRAVQGRPFIGVVANFAEAGVKARSFHTTIDWGDQSSPSRGMVLMRRRGHFVLLASHRYRQAGTFQVTVTISDSTGHSATVESTATVRARGRRR